ncbi:MAG: cell division protein ZapA [Treponema sp.]|nr:cell division protein ZapA [Treponema sp.]
MAISDFVLDILGTSFSITVDEDPEYLNEILGRYRTAVENTRETFNLKDPLTAAILTGFMVSEELYRLQRQEEEAREAEEVANTIIARIDKVLEDTPSEEA